MRFRLKSDRSSIKPAFERITRNNRGIPRRKLKIVQDPYATSNQQPERRSDGTTKEHRAYMNARLDIRKRFVDDTLVWLWRLAADAVPQIPGSLATSGPAWQQGREERFYP